MLHAEDAHLRDAERTRVVDGVASQVLRAKAGDCRRKRGRLVRCNDAVVRDCEIAYNRGRACAVYMTKGLVTGCDIHDNRNYSVSELASGNTAGSGAGVRVDGGTLERSRIHDNYSYGSGGGLWLRDNAIVRNCLIYGNHAGGSGGAIHANSGSPKTYHCNIGGNTADAGGAAVNSGAGTPQYVNCIVFGNGSVPSGEILTASGVTASFTYCLLPVTRSGTGNGVLVAYYFSTNGLYEARYIWTEKHSNENLFISDYDTFG